MQASLSHLPADGQHFAFEYKWDGVRAITFVDGGSCRIQSRNLLDITHRYPELQVLAEAGAKTRAIFDGEIVALDETDRPSFSRLQQRMHLDKPADITRASRDIPIFYLIFDILYFDDRSTMHLPYTQRRAVLDAQPLIGPHWQRTPAAIGDGSALLESARQLGLEGIVAKRLTSTYQPGARSRDWLKIKLVQRQEFVIGGWIPEAANASRVGSVLVGYYDAPGGSAPLRYAGRVGSGLASADAQRRLLPLMAQLSRSSNPFADDVPNPAPIFVDPAIVIEVEHRGWTGAGMLRQPAYKGVRFDKNAGDVTRNP